jgi:hypothetical protein
VLLGLTRPRNRPPLAQSTYSGKDYQGGSSRPKPIGNDTSGGRSGQGGQRGQKSSYSTSKSKGTYDQASSSPSYPSKRGRKKGDSQVTPPLPCRSVVGGRLQDFADFWDTLCPNDSPVPGIILELKAVLLGVKHFRTCLKNQRVSLFLDNSTVVSYIRKQGGTHSLVLCKMTWELLQFCCRENIILVPRHILGKHNILADALSRLNKLVSTEWTLHMDVVQAIRS